MRKPIFSFVLMILSTNLLTMSNRSNQVYNRLEQQVKILSDNRENRINQYKQQLEIASKKKIDDYKKKIEIYKNKRIENFIKKVEKEKNKQLDNFIEKLDKQIASISKKVERQKTNLKQGIPNLPAVAAIPSNAMTRQPPTVNILTK